MLLAAVDWLHYLFMIPLIMLSVFLILLILVQRGRGGGLTGALGGMGGQSAFGTKAGDLFTRITIITAAIWVLLSMASLKFLNARSSTGGLSGQRGSPTVPASGAGGIPVSDKGKTGGGKEGDKATPDSSDSKGAPATGEPTNSAPAPATTPSSETPAETPSSAGDTSAKPADAAKP